MDYVIGIDLGTTNCTMAYTSLNSEAIEQFSISQVVSGGVKEEKPSLPSFIYFPLEEELNEKVIDTEFCVGFFAKERGAELPSRVIFSAKSWLSHAGIDRREPILPLGGGKLSPLASCAEFLKHLKAVWDEKMTESPFCDQKVLVTVPASFDPSARQLVQEAAELAEYPEIILLEEPQAAFYSWLGQCGDGWREQLEVGDRILVVDIGGGTTDFSLIDVEDSEGDMQLSRVAVGSHLLLGGDNIDLTLAYFAKHKLEEEGHAIDDWQLQQLTHACRVAKEVLFSEKPPKDFTLTIQGRGSRLIGGQIQTKLTAKEAEKLILDGFFPISSHKEVSEKERALGLQQAGLPFARDPRISHQLAQFLTLDEFVLPTAILFNGGTLKAAAFQKRIVAVLNHWAEELDRSSVKVLNGSDLDFAVGQGAAYYGLVREGKGIRIKGGVSRSYYIGVEDAAPAVPGIPTPLRAICVVPFGMEEGSEAELGQTFALLLGEHATFRFFSCDREAKVGEVLANTEDLEELHPIETILDRSESDGRVIHVTLKSRVTELGVLEIWCQSADDRKWKLEFDIREKESAMVCG